MRKFTTLFILLFTVCTLLAQTDADKGLDAITKESIKGQMKFLASNWTEGRAVGTKGAYLASDYIASMLQVYGIKPFGDVSYTRPSRKERSAGVRPEKYRTYFQNFSLIQYEPGGEQFFSIISEKAGRQSALNFTFKTDFYVRTGTVGKTAEAPLVFAGYGFANSDEEYDDLKKIDLNGKIAVILRGFPGHKDSTSVGFKKFAPKGRYAAYYLERNKRNRLKEAGAVAIIQIDNDFDPMLSWATNDIYYENGGFNEAGNRSIPYYSKRLSMPGKELKDNIPEFVLTPRAINYVFSGSGIRLKDFEQNVANDLKPASQIMAGKSVAFKTTVKSEVVKARNVIGYIEGEKKDEFIVIGGHYDHIGKSDGIIYNGADDNASGTVGVMTIAKAFMETGKKPEKSIIFAAWTGEEKGLLGSRYFVENAKEEQMNISLHLNYDMIARYLEHDTIQNQATMMYTKANYMIEETTRKFVDKYDIGLDLKYHASEKPSGGSDHSSFASEGIPVFYFIPALHTDYHTERDELSKLNYDKMLEIIKIGFLNTWEFANTDDWKKARTMTVKTAEP